MASRGKRGQVTLTTPVMGGLSSVGWKEMVNLCTKLEVPISTHYEDTTGDTSGQSSLT